MERIEWIIRAFAQSSTVQKDLFPAFVNVADELAVEWELTLENIENDLLSERQRLCIKELDDYMLSISGPSNIQLWNNDALCNSPEWEYMRTLAKNILNTMGWDDESPPKSDAIYVENR